MRLITVPKNEKSIWKLPIQKKSQNCQIDFLLVEACSQATSKNYKAQNTRNILRISRKKSENCLINSPTKKAVSNQSQFT